LLPGRRRLLLNRCLSVSIEGMTRMVESWAVYFSL